MGHLVEQAEWWVVGRENASISNFSERPSTPSGRVQRAGVGTRGKGEERMGGEMKRKEWGRGGKERNDEGKGVGVGTREKGEEGMGGEMKRKEWGRGGKERNDEGKGVGVGTREKKGWEE
ncbi:hypothetical protein Pcinc_031675 [Petrolisthes cinctipes]|uniref:Uncharacterized protein n=1 Tax=Petrolisthes cinctipes TaxID=88211 RepID=A0AAE1EVQ5_PETCI|nr:hypothetical protein Pcinc_031675 [Petrolisthes cinctipes]